MQRRTAKATLKQSERGVYFRLCYEHFPGLTVAEMLARLSSTELTDWFTYISMRDEAQAKADRDAEAKARRNR